MPTRQATVRVLVMQSSLLIFISAFSVSSITSTFANTGGSLPNKYSSSSASIISNTSPVAPSHQNYNNAHRIRRHNSVGPSTDHNDNHNNNPGSSNKGYGPTILVSSDTYVQTVELHKSHVIECVHEAEPIATVSWYHNNEPIETDGHHHQALGSELVFLETKEHDEGIYHCKASNEFGSATSPEFSLSVTKPNKPSQSHHITQHSVKPLIRFGSNIINGNRPMDIVCEAPSDEKIMWKVNDRKFFAQLPRANDDMASNNFHYSVQDKQLAFNQRMGNVLVNNQREYILTMLLKHTTTYTQEPFGINITCSYQYVKEGAFKWIESDPGQLVVISQDISIKNLTEVGHNGIYRVPINTDMAPPFENLVNGSINSFNKTTSILDSSERPSLLNFNDTLASLYRQHFIPAVLVPFTLVIITLLMLVILFLWRRNSVAHETSAYKREQHHKSYHRHYQAAPPQNSYPPSYFPYAQHDKQIPYIPSSHIKATHHRSHDLTKSLRKHKTWGLFPSSKKHTQLINPFLGVDFRQLSMINNAQCYPSMDGNSRGISLLPRILHSSLSQNNFATAYSTNYIDMRCATTQQNPQQSDQFLASQHRINQQLVMNSDSSKFLNNNNNHLDVMQVTNKNVMYDTPSDGNTPTSTSSSSSLTNTISGQLISRNANLNGGSQSILTSNNTYLSCGNRLPDDKKTITTGDLCSLDQNAFKNADHHYSTIAESISRCPNNNQMDACYEDLDQHQLNLSYLVAQDNKNHSVVSRHQGGPGESLGANDSFRSRISSFLTHQNNSKRNSGASSSTRSSRSASKFNRASNSTYDQQKQTHPYAVTSIRGVTPTPPPPPMSEAMKTLNEQFNLDQLIIFNSNVNVN